MAQVIEITFRVEPEQAAVLIRFLRAVAQQDIVRTLDAPDQVKAFGAGFRAVARGRCARSWNVTPDHDEAVHKTERRARRLRLFLRVG
jgi:hypothetical protein